MRYSILSAGCVLLAASLAGCAVASNSPASSVVPDIRPATMQTFQYIGRSSQAFQVPTHVTKITITAEGAGTTSASGAYLKAVLGVKPGETLAIFVGGMPSG